MTKPNESNHISFAHLKEEFVDWALETKFDGFSKIFKYHTVLARITWSAIFVTCSALTAWLCIVNITDFFQYDVISKLEVVHQRPTTFPVVTFCDNNAFSTYIAEYFMQQAMFEVYGEDLNANLTFEEATTRIGKIRDLAKLRVASPSVLADDKKLFGFPLYTVSSCIFNKIACNLTTDLQWYYSYEYGNCWQYNTGKTR